MSGPVVRGAPLWCKSSACVCVGDRVWGQGGGSVFYMPFQSYGEPLPITLIATRLRKSLHM